MRDGRPPGDLRHVVGSVTLGSTSPRASGLRQAGIGTGCLVVVEQRLDAVRAVLRGAEVVEVAARVGVHRSRMHRWVVRYLTGQLGGGEPSHPPVAEMRREHHRLRSPSQSTRRS